MSAISINLLGIGSARIKFDSFSVYIDAFNNYINSPILNSGDIVLFTHSDEDHFNAEKTINAVKTNNNLIVGPPSICYPLLEKRSVDPKNLKIIYPGHLERSEQFEINDLSIKIYQTKHFVDWEPDHISFLFNYNKQNIYFTGDSYTFNFKDNDIYNLDCLIYSLINKDFLEKNITSQETAKYHVEDLIDIQKKLNPKNILCNHIIDCDWTVSYEDLQKELIDNNVSNIIIPNSSEVTFSI